MQATGAVGEGKPKETGMMGTMDGGKASIGAGSGGLTYSTLANVPKAKRQKLISEAKPMVTAASIFINIAWWSSQMQGDMVRYQES